MKNSVPRLPCFDHCVEDSQQLARRCHSQNRHGLDDRPSEKIESALHLRPLTGRRRSPVGTMRTRRIAARRTSAPQGPLFAAGYRRRRTAQYKGRPQRPSVFPFELRARDSPAARAYSRRPALVTQLTVKRSRPLAELRRNPVWQKDGIAGHDLIRSKRGIRVEQPVISLRTTMWRNLPWSL
ncbi:hypothetical protein OKW43_008142 [Paraburkholderia sp. WC7.3g]